jgi:hypothetical protein
MNNREQNNKNWKKKKKGYLFIYDKREHKSKKKKKKTLKVKLHVAVPGNTENASYGDQALSGAGVGGHFPHW